MRRFKTAIGGLALLLLLLGLFLWQPLGPRASTPNRADPHAAHVLSLVRYVNPFIGTVGNGNVFPGADVPPGMVQWSPDTGPVGITRPAGYFYGDSHITGFSLTHLSGAGCVAYGDIPFMPTVRSVTVSPVEKGYPYSARFSHSVEQASPGYYGVLLNSGIHVQLSATPRSGIGKFTPVPRAAPSQHLRRRQWRVYRLRPSYTPSQRLHPVRELFRLGHLPYRGAAPRSGRASRNERHDAVAGSRREPERLVPTVADGE